MGRIFKALVFLIVLGACGLIGFAFLGDLSPERSEVKEPVSFDTQ